MKKYIALVAIGIGTILMVFNIVTYEEGDPFSMVGGIVVTVVLAGIGGLLVWWLGDSSFISWGIVLLVSILLLCSGGDLISRILSRPSPVVEVQIDNSKTFVEYPADGSADEIKDLNREKYVVDPVKGLVSVWVSAERIGVIAYIVMMLLAMLPKQVRIRIPIQFLFLLGWGGISLWLIGMPIDKGVDMSTSRAMATLWWWGALQTIVWGLLTQGVSTAAQLAGTGASGLSRLIRHPLPAMAWGAISWAGVSLLFVVFDPGVVTWTAGSVLVHETQLTATVAVQVYSMGRVTFFAASAAWRALINIVGY